VIRVRHALHRLLRPHRRLQGAAVPAKAPVEVRVEHAHACSVRRKESPVGRARAGGGAASARERGTMHRGLLHTGTFDTAQPGCHTMPACDIPRGGTKRCRDHSVMRQVRSAKERSRWQPWPGPASVSRRRLALRPLGLESVRLMVPTPRNQLILPLHPDVVCPFINNPSTLWCGQRSCHIGRP
jgi:hypothetical protein